MSIPQMRTITGLQVGAVIFDNSNYILSEIKGLEMPTTRLPRYNLPGQSGGFISNALYGERKIQIKGWVNAPDGQRTTLLTNRINLINALIYQYSNGIPVPLTVTITLENGQVLTTNVYPSENMPLTMGYTPNQVDFEEFFITLIAPGYTLNSQTPTSAIISVPVGGGAAIPTAIPISLAPSSGGSAVINNTGSVPAFPVITLTPPLTSPYIANITQGGFINLLNTNLQVGQNNIVIDCKAQTIFQGVNNITGVQSTDSRFWSILPGNNTITFSAAAGNGTCTVVFYPSFLGV